MNSQSSQESEMQFRKLILQKNILSSSTLALCIKTASSKGVSLSQVLIEQEYITIEQSEKILEEIVGHPKKIGRYEILGEIGSGGMGKVYKAHDSIKKEIVALKVLLRQDNIDNNARFLREAKTIARLNHPNIISLIDLGQEKNQYFFTMQYIKGQSLGDLLKEDSLPPMRKSVELVLKVAKALQYAHDQGVIHRDIKPANIMLDINGEPKVMDFGLAKVQDASQNLSASGAMIGTLIYIAPEQAEGRTSSIDARSDVYALGALLYALLTGRPPFTGQVFTQVLQKILNHPPIPPSTIKRTISKDLDNICLKALVKDKRHRYQTAIEMANDLGDFLQGQRVGKKHSHLQQQIYLWAKQRWLFLLIYFASIFAIAGIFYSLQTQLKQWQGKAREAGKHYQKQIADFSQKSKKNKALANQYFLAAFDKYVHQKEGSIEDLLAAHKFDPDPRYLLFKELLSFHKTSPKERAEVAKKIQKLLPLIPTKTDRITDNIIGRVYRYGIIEKVNAKKAIYHYKKSAKKGLAAAIDSLGEIHFTYLKNNSKAFKYFKQAAQLNYHWSMYFLGESYRRGKGVAKNLKLAMGWHRKAAKLGNSTSMVRLGTLYKQNKKYKQAWDWFHKSVESKDDSFGKLEIGNMYYEGVRVKRDLHEAISWFNRAAEQNNMDAIETLANLRMGNKEKVLRNYKIAYTLWNKISHRSAKAMFNIGKLYEYGLGVGKNIPQAIKWYQKAATRRHKKAKQKIKKLKK